MTRRIAIAVLALGSLLAASSAVSFAQQDQSENRKVTNRVTPEYPNVARLMALRGTVKVEAVVLPNGRVKSVEIKGGHPVLAQAAADAIRKWKWVPATHETREPVTVEFTPKD